MCGLFAIFGLFLMTWCNWHLLAFLFFNKNVGETSLVNRSRLDKSYRVDSFRTLRKVNRFIYTKQMKTKLKWEWIIKPGEGFRFVHGHKRTFTDFWEASEAAEMRGSSSNNKLTKKRHKTGARAHPSSKRNNLLTMSWWVNSPQVRFWQEGRKAWEDHPA